MPKKIAPTNINLIRKFATQAMESLKLVLEFSRPEGNGQTIVQPDQEFPPRRRPRAKPHAA